MGLVPILFNLHPADILLLSIRYQTSQVPKHYRKWNFCNSHPKLLESLGNHLKTRINFLENIRYWTKITSRIFWSEIWMLVNNSVTFHQKASLLMTEELIHQLSTVKIWASSCARSWELCAYHMVSRFKFWMNPWVPRLHTIDHKRNYVTTSKGCTALCNHNSPPHAGDQGSLETVGFSGWIGAVESQGGSGSQRSHGNSVLECTRCNQRW